jgi:hypothetical protein
MSDEQLQVDPQVDPQVEAEARTMGWRPPGEFRGDKSNWVDAQTFVERGRQFMPLLKANNKVLTSQLLEARSSVDELKNVVLEQAESLKALTEFQAQEVKRQVQAHITKLRTALTEARKDDDTEVQVELEEQLEAAKERLKKVDVLPKPPEVKKPADQPPPIEPFAQKFAEDNADWFNVDRKKTALFSAEVEELYLEGLRGLPLLTKAKEKMDAFFSEPGNRTDKSESGSRPGGGGTPPTSGKTYANLPTEAREQIKRQIPQMVGKNKPFPTEEAWSKHFVSVYFAEE